MNQSGFQGKSCQGSHCSNGGDCTGVFLGHAGAIQVWDFLL